MLSERVAEAQVEVSTTFAELAKQSQIVDALMVSLRRRHACWPSRWGWGTVIVLFFYLLFMHSTYQGEVLQRHRLDRRLTELEYAVRQVEAKVEAKKVPKKPWRRR